MVGDYISTSFIGGRALPLFADAGSLQGAWFDEPIATVEGGLGLASPHTSATRAPVAPAAPTRAPASATAR
jgi:hypothetical protein